MFLLVFEVMGLKLEIWIKRDWERFESDEK